MKKNSHRSTYQPPEDMNNHVAQRYVKFGILMICKCHNKTIHCWIHFISKAE